MSGRGLRVNIAARIGKLELDVQFISEGGTLVLIGPNGAGKSSLLAALLGTLPCDRARIEVGDTVLCDTQTDIEVPVEQRQLGYLPQHYALFPHLNVLKNVAFALGSARGRGSGHDLARAETALRDLGVWELRERDTRTLSGGEKQRVALARALSIRPRALLLDEPLAALDVHARHEVRGVLADTLSRLALPTVVVTHDPKDALALGGTIAVLESGRVRQVGGWADLVARPATRFVEEFVASSTDRPSARPPRADAPP